MSDHDMVNNFSTVTLLGYSAFYELVQNSNLSQIMPLKPRNEYFREKVNLGLFFFFL